MSSPTNPDFDLMLEHAGWMRALARRLAIDANSADDLVQSTWTSALERPPEPGTPVRRWLAAVVRNFAHQERRVAERRTRRELLAARSDTSASASDVAENIALQRALLAAVSALDEPYRTVIFQRYYEGLPPRAIAQRTGVPVKTVKTRLGRALAQLRTRLDRDHGGDRSAWLSACVALVPRSPSLGDFAGALLVDTKIKVAVAVAVAAGALWVVVSRAPERAGSAVATAPIAGAAIDAEPTTEMIASDARAEASGASIETDPAAAPAQPVQPAAAVRMRGRVIDVERRPVANLDLCNSGTPTVLATSDARGEFDAAMPSASLRLEAKSDVYTTVFSANVWVAKAARYPVLVVVAPRRPLAGIVVDRERLPVPDAAVSVLVDRNLRSELGEVLDGAPEAEWTTKTDAAGHFELRDAPECRGRLQVVAAGHATHEEPLPERATFDLVIVLGPPQGTHFVLRGRVVDAHGSAVAAAHVAFGAHTVTSAANGRFEIDIDPALNADVVGGADGVWEPEFDTTAVVAVKAGSLPARFPLPPIAEMVKSGEPQFVTLQLGGPPLSMHGIVQDRDGHPVPGAEIWPIDATKFGNIPVGAGGEGMSVPRNVEDMLGERSIKGSIVADSKGRFAFEGLLDRSYRMAAFDGATLRYSESEPLHGGASDVILLLDGEAILVRVAGRVRSEAGTPIDGARVFPLRGATAVGFSILGAPATTDAEGRFEFERCDARELTFQIEGSDLFSIFRQGIAPDAKLDSLELTVSRRCHMQVDLGDRREFADSFEVRDGDDQPLDMMRDHGAVMMSGRRMQIIDGRSEVVAAREKSRMLVLYRDSAEVARVPLQLRPGEVQTVRP